MYTKRYQIDSMRSQAMQPHHQQAIRPKPRRKFGPKILPPNTQRVILNYGGPVGNIMPAANSPARQPLNERVVELPLREDHIFLMDKETAEDLLVTLWSYALLDERSFELIVDTEKDIMRQLEMVAVRLKDPWFGDWNEVQRVAINHRGPSREDLHEMALRMADKLKDGRETRIARFLAQLEVRVNEAAA